jgi:DNA (cytosine-5)-methyltransferase 1
VFQSPWASKPKKKAKKKAAPKKKKAKKKAKKAPKRTRVTKKVTKKAAVQRKPTSRPKPRSKKPRSRKPAGLRVIEAPGAPREKGGRERAVTRKVGRKKRKGGAELAQVWLEGKILERAGFRIGDSISVEYDQSGESVVIRLDPAGPRVVSRHREKPVVDLVEKALTKVMAGVDRVVVDFENGYIVLSPQETKRRIEERLRRRDGTVGSAFTGAGFMDLSAELAGYIPRYGIEIDPRYADMYQANREQQTAEGYPLTVIKQPIEEALFMNFRAMKQGREEVIPHVELLLMGIPCDPWSRARGDRVQVPPNQHPLYHMTTYALRLVAASNPMNVVIEEVPEYVEDKAHRDQWGTLQAVLTKEGYHVTHKVIDSADLGYAAGRRRVYIVATTKPGFSWAKAIQNARAPKGMRKMRDILLPPNHPAITSALESQGNWFSTRAASGIGKFMRDHWKRPKFRPSFVDPNSTRLPTLIKRYYAWQATGPFVRHPTKPDTYRMLTIEEIRRAHGVPEGYVLPGAVGTQAEVMGQAVVVPVVEGIIRALPGGAAERTVDVRHRRVSNPAPVVPMYYGPGPLFSTLPGWM